MADGSKTETSIHAGKLVWDGQEQNVLIHCMNGESLVGLSQDSGYRIDIPARAGETVTFVPLP